MTIRSSKIITLLLPLFLGLFFVGSAVAAGTPDLQQSATASNPLFGQASSVSTTASLGIGQVPGYNLTFRAVLPAGISYAGGSPLLTQTINNAPGPGQTTLIFANVSDLAANSSQGINFNVNHNTSLYAVGSSFAINYDSYVNSNPRFVPAFNPTTGAAIGSSFTGSSSTTTTATISAISLSKSGGGQLLRGVHDKQSNYSLTVRNNAVNPTTGVVLEDYLPAGLEYLGCQANPDNTTNAPTNPGSANEYPNSGPIVVGPVSGCVAPDQVNTVLVSGGSGPVPDGVYTYVRWTIGALAANATQTFNFRAAVPLSENTMSWSAPTPTPASGQQAVNLNNNSGPETVDGTSITNRAFVSGNYLGGPVSSSASAAGTAKDIIISKTSSSGALAQGAITIWTLTMHTGEYRYSDDLVVSDTLPNSYCPIGPVNYTGNADPACAPTGDNPSAAYTSVTQNPDGTWIIVWNKTTAPLLAHTTVNDTLTMTFPSRTRTNYTEPSGPLGPILAQDSVSNSVTVAANTFSRCTAPGSADCATPGPQIWSNGVQPDPATSSASSGQAAGSVSINKEIVSSRAQTNCTTASYSDTAPVFLPGDKVCFRLTINFPTSVDTSSRSLTDFLPPNAAYDAASVTNTASNTTVNLLDDSEAANGLLFWEINGGVTPVGAQRFQVTFSATIDPVATILTPVDIAGNLMKFSITNTLGTGFPLRDQIDFETKVPVVSLAKGVRQVNAGPINNPPIDGVTVNGGSNVIYEIRVNPTQMGADNIQVWDRLPAQFDCLNLSAISDAGLCVDGGAGRDTIRWTVPTVAENVVKSLLYTVTIPTSIGPEVTLRNDAGVREYQTATNIGGSYTYIPQNNIDPSVLPATWNVPPIDDLSTVLTPNVAISKTGSSSIIEANNTAIEATIGETINYTVTATLPRGSTFPSGAVISDTPNSVTLQPVTSASATLNGNPLPGTWSLTTNPVTNLVTVNIPPGYAVPVAANDLVVLLINTQVANIVGNAKGGQRSNQARIDWTDTTAKNRLSSTINTRIVEPTISQAKTNNAGAVALPNQIVTYTLTTTNSNALYTSNAHNTVITDLVPTGVTPINAINLPLADGDVVPGTGGATWNSGTRVITGPAVTINRNANAVWSYRVRVDSPATGGTILTNTAAATTTSMPGVVPGERTAPSTGYVAASSSSITVSSINIASKTASPTSATIGNAITYSVDAVIPAGLNIFNATVVDILPSALDFDGYVSATCVSGCTGPGDTPIIQTYAPTISGANTTIAWDAGDIASSVSDRTLRLVYTAHVRNTHRVSGLQVLSGQTIVNSVRARANFTNKFVFNPASLPALATFDYLSPIRTSTVPVIEPAVTLNKQVQINGGPWVEGPAQSQPGDILSYRIVATNSGNSPAYDLVLNDLPNSNLINVTLTTGSGFNTDPWTPGNPAMSWSIPGPIAGGGGTVTVGYTGNAPNSSILTNASLTTNSAGGTYLGVPFASRIPGWIYRNYTMNNDSVTVNFEFPEITLNKTTGGAGFPNTANAQIGTSFPWRIVVTNGATTARAFDLDLEDTLPPAWTYNPGSTVIVGATTAEPTVTSLPGGDRLNWGFTGQTIAPGASVTVSFTATPQPSARTFLPLNNQVNSSTAVVDDAQGNPGNASGAYTATDTAIANLQVPILNVVKTPDSGSVNAGSGFSWTVVINNTGSAAANSVVVSDTVDAGVTYAPGAATAFPAAGFSETSVVPAVNNGSTPIAISWAITSIPAGSSRTITVPMNVPVDQPGGTIVDNIVNVNSYDHPVVVSDTGQITTTTAADLRAIKSFLPAEPVAGTNFSYSLGVQNLGPSLTPSSTITDTLPAGVSYISSSPPAGCSEALGVVACNAGALSVGQTQSFTINVALASTAVAVNNTNIVSGPLLDPVPGNNQAPANFVARQEVNLALTKTAAPTIINNGENTIFTIQVNNQGPSSASAVVVTDTLPAGFDYVSDTLGACTNLLGTVTCNLGNMLSGATRSLDIVAKSKTVGLWTNTATATTASVETNPGDNTDTAAVTVNPSVDLAIVKTAPASANPGAAIAYNLAITNNGPDNATGVVAVDTLPAGVGFVSASAGCIYAVGPNTVSCTIGALANGVTVNRSVTITAPLVLANSTISNRGDVSGAEYDPVPANNVSIADTIINPAADLRITKTGTASVNPGETISYGLNIANLGPSNATGVVVADVLPPGVVFVSAPGCSELSGTVSCAIGNLANGANVSLTITVIAPLALANSTITNNSSVSGNQFDPNLTNNTDAASTNINKAADLRIIKSQSTPGPINPGSNLTYTLSIDNLGPDDATGVTVSDLLPPGATFVSADPGCSESAGTVTCAIGALTNGTSLNRSIVVTLPLALANSTATNNSSITGAEFDPNLTNNQSSVQIAVVPAADLAIVKTQTGAASMNPEGNITYTLTVSNNGPNNATGVIVSDTLPSGTIYVSSPGCSESSGTVTCLAGNMANGSDRVFTVTITVPLGLSDSLITNNAAVVADQFDPSPANNEDSINKTINPAADLAIIKTGPLQIDPPGNIVYNLQVTNNGPDTASGVVLGDNLPAGVAFVSASPGCSEAALVVSCNIGALASGATVNRQVTIYLPVSFAAGTITNNADVLANEYDPDPNNNDDSFVTDVNPAADKLITKSADPSVINQTENGDFILTVTNNGPSTALNVTVQDVLPAELEYVSDNFGCSHAGGVINCSLGDMLRDDVITIRIKVKGLVDGVWNNEATVYSPTHDQDPSNNSDDANMIVAPTSDLRLTKTAPASANPGDVISYSMLVENLGPALATNVVINDPLPVGMTFVSSADCSAVAVCNLGSIAAGDSRSVTINVSVDDSVAGTISSNQAEVGSDEYDPDPDNNRSSADTLISQLAELSALKTGPATVRADSRITWQIEVSNSGPNPAANSTLSDPLPAGLSDPIVTTSQGSCTPAIDCNLGIIAVGSPALITISALVPRDAVIGSTISNTVNVTTTTPERDPGGSSTSETEVLAPTPYQADLRINKTQLSSPVKVGGVLSYRIDVDNSGETSARNVLISDPLPNSLRYLSSSASQGSCSWNQQGARLTCRLGSLAGGSSARINIRAEALRSGDVVNLATLTASEARISKSRARVTTAVGKGRARLAIDKRAMARVVASGSRVRYKIRVSNRGPDAAEQVQVCDLLPSQVSVIRTFGGQLSGNQVCWEIDLLRAGESRQFQIIIRIDDLTAAASVRNRAVASADNARKIVRANARVNVKSNKESKGGGITG